MRHQILDALLSQLLNVVAGGQAVHDNAFGLEFNGQIANTATGADLNLAFQFGRRRQGQRSGERHANKLLQTVRGKDGGLILRQHTRVF